MSKLKRAIVVTAYNRPQYLEKVLDGLEKQGWEPTKYDFVAFVDGPRENNEGDKKAICECCTLLQGFISRMADVFGAATIINRCENAGPDASMLDALYQVFVCNNYDEAIIVEDDIVPLDGFRVWMERGLNVIGKKVDACCIQGTVFSVSAVGEPGVENTIHWFTKGAWATTGKEFRHHLAHVIEKMYEDKRITSESFSKVLADMYGAHPFKRRSKFITWRGDEPVSYKWGWNFLVNVVYEVHDLFEMSKLVVDDIGVVGTHTDGNEVKQSPVVLDASFVLWEGDWIVKELSRLTMFDSIPTGLSASNSMRYKSGLRIALNLAHQNGAHIFVETGTQRVVDDGGGSCTTVLGAYVKRYGRYLWTVDVSRANLDVSMQATKDYASNINYVESDSIEFLKKFKYKIDFLLLDSMDCPIEGDATAAQQHQLAEFKAAEPMLHKWSVLALDDTYFPNGGKTRLLKNYLIKEKATEWLLIIDLGQTVFLKVR